MKGTLKMMCTGKSPVASRGSSAAKRRLWLSLLSTSLLTVVALGSQPVVADDLGEKAFVAQKCNKCHSIETHDIEATVKSEKMRGPDLSTVGKERASEWIMQYVRKEFELNDKNHRAKWEGPDKELKAIADWLASLE